MDTPPRQSTQPLRKKKYHHGDLRNAIIDSVAKLIEDKRSLAFQLKEVANLVGATQPAIYRHFEGKDDLLVETALRGYRLQRELREQAIEATGGTALEGIIAILEAYVLFSVQKPGFFLLIKNLETNEILSSSSYLEERKVSIRRITNLIEDCIEDGLFSETDTEIAHSTLQSAAYGLAHLYITGQIQLIASKQADDPELPTRVFSRCLSGLLSEAGKTEFAHISDNRRPLI